MGSSEQQLGVGAWNSGQQTISTSLMESFTHRTCQTLNALRLLAPSQSPSVLRSPPPPTIMWSLRAFRRAGHVIQITEPAKPGALPASLICNPPLFSGGIARSAFQNDRNRDAPFSRDGAVAKTAKTLCKSHAWVFRLDG